MIDKKLMTGAKADLKSISDQLGFTDSRLPNLVKMISMFEDGSAFNISDDQQSRLDELLQNIRTYCIIDDQGNPYEEGTMWFKEFVKFLYSIGVKNMYCDENGVDIRQ